MPTKPSHSKCLRLSFWKPGGHSKLQICHIDPTRRKMFIPLGLRSHVQKHIASLAPKLAPWWGPSGPGSRASPPRFAVAGSLTANLIGFMGLGPGTGLGNYPLVNIQKTMENHHRNSGFPHEKWWCSIVMLVYQRVSQNWVKYDNLPS